MDVILNKRRAKIDDAVDNYDVATATGDDAAGADARQQPDIDYHPEREEVNPFLADDDEEGAGAVVMTATPVVREAPKPVAVEDDVSTMRVVCVSCVCRVRHARA